MVASVWVPEAAFVPDQPPLAVQLCATGLVDQVSTGVRLPVADVLLALSVTTPAVCALAAPAPKRNRTSKEIADWTRMKNVLHESEFERGGRLGAPTSCRKREVGFCGWKNGKILALSRDIGERTYAMSYSQTCKCA